MKNAILILISLILTSCAESKMLLKSLNKYEAPLDYLHDSEIRECDKSVGIAFTELEPQALDSATSVTKIDSKVLPFIVYNYQEVNMAVNMGESSLDNSYSDFFRESFYVESQRTGCYTLDENTEKSEYSLEITYDTCKVNSKYHRNSTVLFLLFAYSMNFQEIGFPAETDLAVKVKLSKGSKSVFEKTYSTNRIQPFINQQTVNVNKLRSDFVINMAESLSLVTKECIEEIISDLNVVVENHERYISRKSL